MIYIRKIESGYSKLIDDNFEENALDPSNYVAEIRYLSQIDGKNIWWHEDRKQAAGFATAAEAQDAVRVYRTLHGDTRSRIDIIEAVDPA